MNEIKCPKCRTPIEIDKALEGQIEARLLAKMNTQHLEEMEQAKIDAMASAQKEMEEKLSNEREKLKSQVARDAETNAQKQEILIEQLRSDAEASKEANRELREELKKLNTSLLEERKAKDNAELDARKKLAEEVAKIREEAKKEADEAHRFKEQELQKQLNDTKVALDAAQRKAEQGSQQQQGEVLELELEALIRNEFPRDVIEEVKKGQRGADIKQHVKNARFEECGILLWESKNAKWSNAWVAKFKNDIREAKAEIGIIVSCELPDEYGDMHMVENNVWVVKPQFVLALAVALRETIIQVFTANRNVENKDEKMEFLYQFLTGVEFRNRIEAIVASYNDLQDEMEKEKRAAEKRWGKQEKAYRAMIANTYGLYGEFQGIIGNELQIPLLEADESPEQA